MNKWCLQKHGCCLANSVLRIFTGYNNWKTFQWRTILNLDAAQAAHRYHLFAPNVLEWSAQTDYSRWLSKVPVENLVQSQASVLWQMLVGFRSCFAPLVRFTQNYIKKRKTSSSMLHVSMKVRRYVWIFPPCQGGSSLIYTCPMSWTMKSTTSLESLLNMPCQSLSTTRCVK